MTESDAPYSHVCFVVSDLQASARRWASLTGAGPWYVMQPAAEDKEYRGTPANDEFLLAIAFLGATCLELYQPLDDRPSFLREILETRGEGFHHVWPRIEPLQGPTFDAKCQHYEDLGLSVAMRCRFPGVGRAVFYDALDSIGGFIEVLEAGDSVSIFETLHAAHRDWDGADPIRPFAALVGA